MHRLINNQKIPFSPNIKLDLPKQWVGKRIQQLLWKALSLPGYYQKHLNSARRSSYANHLVGLCNTFWELDLLQHVLRSWRWWRQQQQPLVFSPEVHRGAAGLLGPSCTRVSPCHHPWGICTGSHKRHDRYKRGVGIQQQMLTWVPSLSKTLGADGSVHL